MFHEPLDAEEPLLGDTAPISNHNPYKPPEVMVCCRATYTQKAATTQRKPTICSPSLPQGQPARVSQFFNEETGANESNLNGLMKQESPPPVPEFPHNSINNETDVNYTVSHACPLLAAREETLH